MGKKVIEIAKKRGFAWSVGGKASTGDTLKQLIILDVTDPFDSCSNPTFNVLTTKPTLSTVWNSISIY